MIIEIVLLIILIVILLFMVRCYLSYKKPESYHRFQSNLCNPQSDKQPITFPGPTGISPPHPKTKFDALVCAQKYGQLGF
jgi:hypothetical protein